MLNPLSLKPEFKFISIDPGLNNSGVAVWTVCQEPFDILNIQAQTLKAARLVDHSGLDDEDHREAVHKRLAMGRALCLILEEVNPAWVVCESPFFNPMTPNSFAVLTEVLVTFYDTVMMFNPSIRFSQIPPLLVKKCLGVAGQKGKEVVKEALAKMAYIEKLEQDIKFLDEHSIDAIAVGNAFLRERSIFASLLK